MYTVWKSRILMRRRHFCTAAGVGCLGSLAGCTALDLPFNGGHPFADSTVAVRIEDRGKTVHDVASNAREALDFWAAQSSQYVEFGIDFEIVDESPDIVMAYVDTPEGCSDVENYNNDVLGCAPLIRPGNRISRPVTAYVVAADRPYGSVRTTAKHELGHILGLGHEDEPLEIMSNRPEDRIRLYAVRVEIWETVLAANEQAITAMQRLNDGINGWNDEEYDSATAAFDEAETAFGAAQQAIETAANRLDDLVVDPPLETVDRPRLDADFDARLEWTSAGSDVASAMGAASAAAADNDRSTAREQSAAGRDYLSTFHETAWPEARVVAVALGLVRGFNRDDDEVGMAGEEL